MVLIGIVSGNDVAGILRAQQFGKRRLHLDRQEWPSILVFAEHDEDFSTDEKQICIPGGFKLLRNALLLLAIITNPIPHAVLL
ncbi:hypothetical protein SDC9_181390 [bioreactor metagenome]|uniref:Uncharacterized protein n=1 Tax=bioreactor metagenome TaxID=1076179 RepID=A0A645H4G6_9ZZZZ